MEIKKSNCLNCGASMDYNKIQNGVYQCPYCREYYHIDQYGTVEEYKVKLKYGGKIVTFYIGSMEIEPVYDAYRTIDGRLHTTMISSMPNITLTLHSINIEEEHEVIKTQQTQNVRKNKSKPRCKKNIIQKSIATW